MRQPRPLRPTIAGPAKSLVDNGTTGQSDRWCCTMMEWQRRRGAEPCHDMIVTVRRMPVDPTPTVPALVQRLAQLGASRLRADFTAQGMIGLRPAHSLILVPLLGGGRHASDLAETLGVSRQAVAQMVATLERDGYLARVSDPGDARARLICLTAKGRSALQAMRASAEALEETWAERLGADDLATLRRLIGTLLADQQ